MAENLEPIPNDGQVRFLFGKWRGKTLAEIPRPYLEWYAMLETPFDKHLQDTVFQYLNDDAANSPSRGKKQARKAPKPKPQQSPAGKPQVQGSFDASHLFNPQSDWPERQEWDGESPPWCNQLHDNLDAEFREVAG